MRAPAATTTLRAALRALAAAALLAGCAHTLTPTLEARQVPLLFMERSPLRLAILVDPEERDRVHELSSLVPLALSTVEVKAPLTRTLQDTLGLSLTPLFERVTVVPAPPPAGAYHLVVKPKITEAKLDIVQGLAWSDFVVELKGVLRVLDQAGTELGHFETTEKGTTRLTMGVDPQAASGTVVSQTITGLVRKWAEQMRTTPAIRDYAERVGATLVAGARPGAPRQPPSEVSVSISHPAEGARVSEEAVTLVGVASAPRGIQRLELVVNGRSVPVSRDVRAQAGDVQSHAFTATIPLRAGENVIALTAIDGAGAANQAVRTVHREAARPAGPAAARPSTGERWAIVIGIDQYQDLSVSTLRYAAADAEAIFRFLTTKGGVKPTSARLLVNQQATQRNLRQVLGDFLRQRALRDDEVIIYYAGHGTTEPDASAEGGVAKYLVPWDADPASLFSTAIPMEEIDRIFGRMSARKILLIQDTCFSGGAGGRTFLAKGLTVRATSLTDRFLQELSQKEGRMILTASDVNQVSTEDPALGHGVFTHYLLQALDSGAADLDGDGVITVRELHLYLQRRVHEHSRGAQTPQLYNIGDMVLVERPR
jgi:uncharacterized caspase-like protein